MPRIQEYLPEQEAAGPQGALTPNLEQVTAQGRGIESFGRSLGAGADAIYSRQAQTEQDDASSTVALQRANKTDEMNEGINNGTFDVETFKKQYQDWQTAQADTYETAAGRNTFWRQSNRTLGALIQRGNKGQAIIAYKNGITSFNTVVDANAATVRTDPTQFDDVYDSLKENADDMVKNGKLKAADAPALIAHASDAIAREAVLGTANTNPDEALKLLNDPTFASHMTPATQDALRTQVRVIRDYQDKDAERKANLQEKADKAAQGKWMTDHAEAIANGSISPKDVLLKSGIKDWDVNLAFAQKAKQAQELVQITSPAVMREMQERILLPASDPNAITDLSQVAKDPRISPTSMNKFTKWYFKTPQGEAKKANEKMMMEDIKGKLKVPGMPDQDYNNRVVNAMHEYQDAKAAAIAAGEDPSELTDPKSKNYFPIKVRTTSPMELMQAQAARMSGQLQLPTTIVTTTPGIIPVEEIEREAQNGKTAVFDKKTKKFLRYKEGK